MIKSEAGQLIERGTKSLIEALEAGHSDNLKAFLVTAANFHRYSLNNWLLIYSQCPEATRVSGYKTWQKLGRQVRKGGHSIKILAPRQYKKEQPDGETKEGMYFRTVAVFDVSQTDGADLPTVFGTVGDPGEYLVSLETFILCQGIEIVEADTLGGARGQSHKGKIGVLTSLNKAERTSTLIHELAHELMHGKDDRKNMAKAQMETEAEAVSFIVGQAIGIKSLGQAADYIQLWKGDVGLFMSCLSRIHKCAKTIIDGVLES